MNDKNGGLRKEFTYNRRKKDGEEGLPKPKGGRSQAPPEEGMYKLGVVGSLLLLACTRSSSGGDVPGGDLMLDVGIKERGRKMDQSLMFNARNFEG